MVGPFEAIEAKVDRAGEHLDALIGDIRNWAETHPYRFVSEPGYPSREHHIRVYFSEEPRLLRWGLIFGDFVHNLRSVMDQIAWHFAAREVPIPRRTTAFPIYSDSGKYSGSEPGFGGRQAGTYKIADITDVAVRTLIERAQPYNSSGGYETSPLYWVQEFDTTDKHKIIIPAVVTPFAAEAIVRTGPISGQVTATARVTPLEHGADVLTVVSEQETELEADPKLTIAVTLNLGANRWEIGHLAETLFGGTVEAVTSFQPLIV